SQWVCTVLSSLRRHGITAFTIAGGPHPTFFPEFIQTEGLDAINIGEGEGALVELADCVEHGREVTNIQNLNVKHNGTVHKNPLRPLVDINTLPPPDRTIYLKYEKFRRQRFYNFLVSRGCHFSCSYCFVHKWRDIYQDDQYHRQARLRDIDLIIKEIKQVATLVDIKQIDFSDSTFNLDKKWTIQFLKSYTEHIQLPFMISIRPNLLTEEVVKAIANTQYCAAVRIGVEVGNEKNRSQVLKKNITNAQIYRATDLLKRYKVKVFCYTMYGIPGETFDEASETITMMQKIDPDYVGAHIFKPYPGMEITKKAMADGYVTAQNVSLLGKEEQYQYFHSVLQQPELLQTINLMKVSYVAIHFPRLWPLLKRVARIPVAWPFTIIYSLSNLILLIRYIKISR
ncbi:MAG: B12-binding domain-containing radical SAM protein, partial [Magnetococcales bacterium]|nr:B12-binding domain-containing radical SAM protein [Magnetococcales bacterium]